MRMLRTLAVGSLLVSASACIVGEAGDDVVAIDAKKTATIRVVSHNIEKKQDVLEQTIAKAKAIDAHAIALQEVCPTQVQWLLTNYSGWTINYASNKKRTNQGCPLPDGTQDFPNDVVIVRGGATVESYDTLGGPTNAPGNKLVCLKFERANVPVHVCSVHLIAGDWTDPTTGTEYDGATVREQQTTGIKRIARDHWFGGAKNHFAILAGDFNSQPSLPALDRLYDGALGGNGDFTEYNRSGGGRAGELTTDAGGDASPRKIDYVFFSTNRASIEGPAVDIRPDGSDHHMLISTVHMKK